MAESTFFRRRTPLLQTLAEIVHRALQPALRLEVPLPRDMIGREAVITECLTYLHTGASIALTGPGGVGKTTAGIALAQHWRQIVNAEIGEHHSQPNTVFWYTVRLGLNDSLTSFIFALGYFLHELGASALWRQLLADQGVIQAKHVLGIVRHDLHQLHETIRDEVINASIPLFCIDEVDLLNREIQDHAQLISLLEECRELVPMVLIGQKLVIEPHHHRQIEGLSSNEIMAWLGQYHIPLSDAEVGRLQRVTQGNPTLLTLFQVLHRRGDNLTDLLRHLPHALSTELLLERVWQRLDDGERSLLMQLSVFRGAIPMVADPWRGQQRELTQLIEQRLVEPDGQAGISVVGYAREFVLGRMPSEIRLACHLIAADLRATLGQFTDAAYHYLEGRQPAMAVWIWWAHRFAEKERGQARIAQGVFHQLAPQDMGHEEDQRIFALLRAFLAEILGTNQEVLEALGHTNWPAAHWAAPAVARLRAIALERQGHIESAIEQFRQGARVAQESLPAQMVQLHLGLGHAYMDRLSDLEQASTEATMAGVWAERFLGIVAEHGGQFDDAHAHYTRALALTVGLRRDRLSIRARVLQDFGILGWKRGDSTHALQCLLEAAQVFEAQGDLVRLTMNQINLSAAYLVAGAYTEALATAEAGLKDAEQSQNIFLAAGLMSNASEACYYLNRLDDAERYALQCLRYEEPAHQVNAMTVLGIVQRARGETESAESSLKLAIQAAQDNHDPFGEAPAWRWLARLYRDQHKTPEASVAFEHALQLYSDLKLTHEIEATHGLMEGR